MRRPASSLLFGLGVLAFGVFAASATAQVGVPPPESPDAVAPTNPSFGTSDFSIHTIQAFGFVPFSGSAVFEGQSSGGRYAVSGNTCLEASLDLPNGAIVDHAELEGCDASSANNLSTTLFVCTNGSCASAMLGLSTGTPGCARLTSAVTPVVIDNQTKSYFAQVCTGGTGTDLSVRAVRYFYKLQVSPAPAVASFLDVPTTHPFFQYIEALKASGITGGCSVDNFCPEQPVLRKQMAAFLAKALGLHWPN